MNIRFLGHATFELEHEGTTVLIDPWLTGNPKAAVAADALTPDAILLTHGHEDHIADVEGIAKRTGAPVATTVEIASELQGKGVDAQGRGYGGTAEFDWGWARFVPAWHTGITPDGTVSVPMGIVIGFGDLVVYHLGDTALFSDLALPGRRTPIDVAIVPIGGHFTMDRIDAVTAVEFVGARTVIPCHYGTFGPIETDVQQFKADVESQTSATVAVLEPGETWAP
jgi:L-ascorbate metabolism protein UlaG (beta-lactamase superfamily)